MAVVAVLTLPVSAALRLGSPFTDGAVFQRDRSVPVWGTADAGAKVTVSFAGQTATAVADTNGRCRVNEANLPLGVFHIDL